MRYNDGRVAQAFDLADITNEAGAPFLRVFCEGAGTPKPASAKLRFRPETKSLYHDIN
jgi:hypothetical protein